MRSSDTRHARDGLLEDYVVPVCEFVRQGDVAILRRLEGTAFFIGKDGLFLTAAHVLRSVEARRKETSDLVGLVVKDHADPKLSRLSVIQAYDYAPEPYDIAIGRTYFYSRSWFSAPPSKAIAGWQDVAALGYPETALNASPDKFNVHLRTLKGYVQRPIAENELPALGRHPSAYELNFPITAGMSGSPLFVADGPKANRLVGVCVGSYSAEVTEYRRVEVRDAGEKYEERQIKVEQYGIAQAVEGLLDWKPNVAGNRTLRELLIPAT